MNPFGITTSIKVSIVQDAAEAAERGFVYHEGYTPLEITEAVVVKDGTVAGNPTVDLILIDGHGNRYVACLTGRLLRSIPCAPEAK